MFKKERGGFGPITIIIIVAAVLIVGVGGYYAVKKSAKPAAETNTSVQGNITATTSAQAQSSGSLRDLFALTKDLTCTISYATSSISTSGTVFISGSMMRGDFMVTGQSSGSLDSHMIKNGDIVFAWTGKQGAKIDITKFDTKAAASSKTKTSVDLDQKVNYSCSNWVKDTTKFTVPTDVNFIDLSAVVNVGAGVNASGCAACNYLKGAEQTQCKTALKCGN